jgi:hypothetical protein
MKKEPPTFGTGAVAAGGPNMAWAVYVFLVTGAGSVYSASVCVPVVNEMGNHPLQRLRRFRACSARVAQRTLPGS